MAALLHGSVALAACVGDCNADRRVTINEVVTGVSVGLGLLPIGQCPAADGSGDGSVAINEVIAAVNNGLVGCPAGFAGDYSGSVGLDGSRSVRVDLTVESDGSASGFVTIDEPAAGLSLRRAGGGGAAMTVVAVSGTVDLESGEFSATGFYVDAGGARIEIEVSGVLPIAGGAGSLSVRIGSFTYSGSFGAAPTPTRPATRTPTELAGGTIHRVKVGQPSLPFDPELLEIDVGDTVDWTWVAGTHSVRSTAPTGAFPNCQPDGRFDSGPKSSGTFRYTFTAPGTYEYHCGVAGHCENFETGVVVVRGTPTPTVTRTATVPPTPTLTPTPDTIAGVSTAMLGIFSGTATNDFGGVFPARLQVRVDSDVVRVSDLGGEVLGLGNEVQMSVQSPTKIFFERPDPFDMLSLTLELTGPGRITGQAIRGSMGMGTFGLALDLMKEN